MNQEKLKNIIILKDLPSNLIEEAIIILKDNNQTNKKRVEDYARQEGKNIIKEFLCKETRKKSINKKKSYFFICVIIAIFILNLIRVHIF